MAEWGEVNRKRVLRLLSELTPEQQGLFPEELRRGDRDFTPEEDALYDNLWEGMQEWTDEDRKDMLKFLDELTPEQQAQFPVEVRHGDRYFTPEEDMLYDKLHREWTYKKAAHLIEILQTLTPEHQKYFPKEVWEGKRDLTLEEHRDLVSFTNEELYDTYGAVAV